MPNVSFYIISDTAKRSVEQVVCQLCVKAAQQSHVQLVLPQTLLGHFDDLLWTFNDTSFLPHTIMNEADEQSVTSEDTIPSSTVSARIQLSNKLSPNFTGIVINETDSEILAYQSQRIIEVVAPNESSKTAARQRFKAYKAAGFTLETFHI